MSTFRNRCTSCWLKLVLVAPVSAALVVLLLAVNATAAESGLRVGRAKVVITPPVGAVMGNSYGITVSTGVTSNVHAKAVVFESGGVKSAVVACDLISLHQPIIEQARAFIAERTGVSPDRVMLAATHCHTSAQTHPYFIESAAPAARLLSEKYIAELPKLIAESVRLAEADLQPARISAAAGREDSISFNRRFLLRDGTVKTNPGRGNPNTIRPMGPIDPTVGVIYIESITGAPLVTIVNFALHVAVMGGSKISADYPHVLSEALARVKGDSMLTVFLNGMSGNINHLVVMGPPGLRGDAESARIGTILAGAVLKTYPVLQPVDGSKLRVQRRAVRVPVGAAPPAAELAAARATVARHGKGASFPEVIRAWRALDLAQYGVGGYWNSEVNVMAFGRDLALVGYPGDSFVELGLAMKQNSPFALTFVSEQSGSGALSYIPNAKAFPEGSYEVESARVVAGGGEVLANAAIQLLIEMFPRP